MRRSSEVIVCKHIERQQSIWRVCFYFFHTEFSIYQPGKQECYWLLGRYLQSCTNDHFRLAKCFDCCLSREEWSYWWKGVRYLEDRVDIIPNRKYSRISLSTSCRTQDLFKETKLVLRSSLPFGWSRSYLRRATNMWYGEVCALFTEARFFRWATDIPILSLIIQISVLNFLW